mgnify:CR=1 FL=1
MKNIDLDLLDDLIAKCESKMASPFKKPKEEKAEPEKEAEPDPAPVKAKKENISAEDMDKLIEHYNKAKD